MSRVSHLLFAAAAGCFLIGGASAPGCAQQSDVKAAPPPAALVQLPPAQLTGNMPLETAIAQRRSVRQYAAAPLTLQQVSQLAWAAQGTTGAGGHRAAPSAMARYPVELYVVATTVDGLEPGIYHYVSAKHAFERVAAGDHRAAVAGAAAGQASVANAPATLVFAAVASRLSARPDARSDRFVAVEVGAAAQNVYLQATALGLGTVIVGGMDADAMAKVLQLPGETKPIISMPVGKK